MKRRTFLKTTFAAFPLIATSSVHLRGPMAPSNRVQLAAIGIGGRGTSVNLNEMASRYEDAQYLAVCDPMKDRREKAKEQFEHFSGKGAVTAYNDFRDVLIRDDIDAVVIATPDHWHVPIAIAAARAGKDMYVEKPLGVSMRWNQVLREAVNTNRRVFQYGTQQRGQEHVHRGCELVRNGYIGELKHIDVWSPHLARGAYQEVVPAEVPETLDYDMWQGPAPERQYTEARVSASGAYHIYEYALGFIAGWGAHPLDVCQWGKSKDTTPPVSYEGKGIVCNNGGLWNTTTTWDIHCEYADGVTMRFQSADLAKPAVMRYRPNDFHGDGTTFYGTEGWISISRGGIYASDERLLNMKAENPKDPLKRTNGHQRDFLDCVKSRERTVNPVETAFDSDAISHLSDIVVRTGRPVRWDPKRETIIGDEDAARYLDRPMRAPWTLQT
jgi:predicted dehydrogenase